MILIILLTICLGVILDIGGLYISIQCTRKRKVTMGKIAYRSMLIGEMITKISYWALLFAIIINVLKNL